VALDQAPEQFVDLHAMITHDLGDIRVANVLFGSIRQRRTRPPSPLVRPRRPSGVGP
jgi:hypothetical protein